MAQVGIREFDAKNMFFQSIGKTYNGVLIESLEDIEKLETGKKYVIKPDMLFGGRGKLGLLGIGLTKDGVTTWLKENYQKNQVVTGIRGTLEIFIVEEFTPHDAEYYISFSAGREGDTVNFCETGGVDIEDNWDQVQSIEIPTLEELKSSDIKSFGITDSKVSELIMQLWAYYKSYGFVYLEVNPFCFHSDTGEIILLDMVAKLDDMEVFRQKKNWGDLMIPNTYGFKENQREAYIRKLDGETGASMKFTVLNPNAKIWTLLAGGGGSLVMTDTLGSLGYADNIGNYGELSGNPDRENTREYTRALFEQMLENGIEGKYLIIAGAIANFTKIDTTFAGIIDVLEEKIEEIKKQKLKILIRRGGINEKKGLKIIKDACERLDISCQIDDSTKYMTEILTEIKL